MLVKVNAVDRGVVRWYNPTKRFGVVKLRNGEELPFAADKQMGVGYMVDHAVWCTIPSAFVAPMTAGGEEIVFSLKKGEDGGQIVMWAPMPVYVEAVKLCLPATRYRVMNQYSYGDINRDLPQVEWEGQDLDDKELALIWDESHVGDDFSCDDYHLIKWFEVLGENGWIRCSDPRRR